REARFVGAAAADLLPGVPHARDPVRWGGTEGCDWSAHLASLAQRLLDGDAALQPLPHACERCDLPVLCRRYERLEAHTDGP
ncbi:MAG: hypothetical protein NZM12_11100, partial [Steroidobacteraceae bacterium]|nr:hypothetical protein [Steroidobacteraceae bacterium]